MADAELRLIDPKELVGHERIGALGVAIVLWEIVRTGMFTRPILVDAPSKTILDGHHRRVAARILGLKKVPCWCVEYLADPSVTLVSRRPGMRVDKEEVVRRGAAGDLYPRKTTKHGYAAPESVAYPLRDLRRGSAAGDPVNG